jgi:hypothetical protein
MKITRLAGLAAFAAASLLLIGSSSQAAFTVPSTLVVGDKTFNFLTYSTTGPNATPASNINVTGIPGPPIGFQISGGFAAIPNTPNVNDSLLTYTVTSSGPGITSVGLFANGSTSGSGFTEVVESVFTNVNGGAGVFLGQIAVIGAGTATLNLGGSFSSLYITKDIQYDVFSTTGTATFSVINQTFSQVIPEPASVVMMGLGLVGAIGAVRLRRKPVVA